MSISKYVRSSQVLHCAKCKHVSRLS